MIPKPITLDFTEPPKREVPSFLTTSNDTRPSVASIAPPVHVVKQRRRLQSRKVNRENLPQPGPDDESGEPQPAIELEQPSEEEMAPYAHLRSSVGDKPVWMLLSKHWSFRQELCDFLAQSLHQLGQQKYRPSLLSVVEAVLEALVVLLQDSVYNVYARAVNILEEVTALTLPWGTSAWPVVARSSILNILANRLLDGQARVRNTASKSLLRIAAQQVQGTDLHVCNSVVKAISNLEGANTTGSTVHASGVLTKVALLVTIMEQHCALLDDDDDDDGVKCTLEYAIRNLEHPNGKVRRASSELIVVLLKQQPDPKIFLDQYHAQLNMFTVEKLKDEGLRGVGTSRDERIVNDITSCPPAVQKIMQACPNFTKVPLSLLTARDWKQRRHFFTLLFEDLQQNDAPLSSTSREEEEIYLKLSQIGLEDPVPFVVASAQTSVVALLRRIENQKATDILLNSLMRSLLRDLASSQERRVAAAETLVKELIAKSKLKTSTLLEIISDDEPLRAGKEVSAQKTKYWKTRCVAFRVLGMIISVRTVKKLTLEEVGGIVAACHHGLASSHPQTRCASCNVAAELIHQGCSIDQFTLGDPQISRILETHLRSVNQGVSATNKSFTNQRLESMVVNLTLDESKDVPNIPEVHAGARMEVPTIKDRILQGNTQADAKVTLNADRPVMRNSKASTGRLIFN